MGITSAILLSTIASFLAGFFWGVGQIFIDRPHGGNGLESPFFFALITAWGASVLSVPAILLFSLPLHRFAIRREKVGARDYAIAGAFMGAVVCLTVLLGGAARLIDFGIPGQMVVPALVISPLVGASAALGFWIAARPDREHSRHPHK